MNLEKLASFEKQFLVRYPGGFEHPEMLEIGKKHKMSKMIEFAQSTFQKHQFDDDDFIIEGLKKVVTQSSMVSVFEKAKFRDYIKQLQHKNKRNVVQGLHDLLHVNMEKGFEILLDEFEKAKLAKWTLISAVPVYFKPQQDYFIKPTTVKRIIAQLDLDLLYHPRPRWEFYKDLRKNLNVMKKSVHPALSPNNAAFTGFLMSVLT